jgi:hypothetical protein
VGLLCDGKHPSKYCTKISHLSLASKLILKKRKKRQCAKQQVPVLFVGTMHVYQPYLQVSLHIMQVWTSDMTLLTKEEMERRVSYYRVGFREIIRANPRSSNARTTTKRLGHIKTIIRCNTLFGVLERAFFEIHIWGGRNARIHYTTYTHIGKKWCLVRSVLKSTFPHNLFFLFFRWTCLKKYAL